MGSPTIALIWGIWRHNRVWATLTAALLVVGSIVVFALPYEAGTPDRNDAVSFLYSTLGGLALLFVFGMFHYTELDPGTSSAGFPRRNFVLPVSSLHLVAVPLLLGVASLLVVHAVTSGWRGDFNARSAVGLSAFMVVYQTILWTCARLGSLRSIVLGVAAIWFLYMGFGGMRATSDSLTDSRNIIITMFAIVGLGAFLASWLHVANQRSGGMRRRFRSKSLVEGVADALPGRTREFRSPEAAQLWLEWRRSGVVLPTCVGGMLILLIAPLAWSVRDEADSTLRILLVIVVMPALFALPVGKGLSKPDFWTTELGLPPFLAVRPLSNRDFITIKMKAAALSAAVTWLLSFVFLLVWLPFVARLDGVKRAHLMFESLYGGTSYAVGLLLIFVLMLITWRFLVGGLWIGLSGSRKLFGLSAMPYAFTPIFIGMALAVVLKKGSLAEWAIANVNSFLPTAVLVLASASLVKFVLAARAARAIGRQYMMVWFATTSLLVFFALLLSQGLGVALPSFSNQIRNVLVLIAILLMPLASVGLASSFFKKNRHR